MAGVMDINDHVRAGGTIPRWDDIPPPDDHDAPPEVAGGNGEGPERVEVDPESYRVDQLWSGFAAELDARAAGGCPVVPTDLGKLDKLLGGGLPPGQVTLLCGSPGAGKTSLAMGWAVCHARAGGHAVVWSLELPEVVAMARLVSQQTCAPWAKVLAGACPDDVGTTGRKLAGLPLYLVDMCGEAGAAVVEALLPAQQAGDVPSLLVVDYAQLLAAGGSDQRASVEAASGWLVEVAKTSGAAVLAISSTSRAAYSLGSGGKVELDRVLSMARDTGRLEFDAAVVLGLVAVREADAEDVPERFIKGWLVAAKNRLGQRGRVAVELDGQAGTVRELAPEEMMAAGGGLSDADLKKEVLRVVAGAEAQGGPLTSKTAICDRVKARKSRVLAAIKSLLHPDDGRLTGGSGKPFQVVEKDDGPTTEARR